MSLREDEIVISVVVKLKTIYLDRIGKRDSGDFFSLSLFLFELQTNRSDVTRVEKKEDFLVQYIHSCTSLTTSHHITIITYIIYTHTHDPKNV